MMIEEITNFFVRLGPLLGYSGQMPSWLANIASFVLALAMIGLICKHMNVAGLLAWNQKRKDEARVVLEAFLVREKADTPTRHAVADRLETLYFLSAYRIYAEQPLRDELIRLQGAAGGQLQWFHIRRAVQLLKIEDGRLTVPNWWKSIDALTIIWAWVMQVIFATFMLYSAFVFFKAKSLSFEDGAILGFAIVFSGWIFLYANSTLWPFAEAKRIRAFLCQEQKTRGDVVKSQSIRTKGAK
ncbi:hypothetical protein [Achromobacter pestifer]